MGHEKKILSVLVKFTHTLCVVCLISVISWPDTRTFWSSVSFPVNIQRFVEVTASSQETVPAQTSCCCFFLFHTQVFVLLVFPPLAEEKCSKSYFFPKLYFAKRPLLTCCDSKQQHPTNTPDAFLSHPLNIPPIQPPVQRSPNPSEHRHVPFSRPVSHR